jgi:hypothetical protein
MNKFWNLVDFNFEIECSYEFNDHLVKYIHFFYILLFSISVQYFSALKPYLANDLSNLLPIWSISWIPSQYLIITAKVLGLVNIVIPLICLFNLGSRTLRIICFLSLYSFWGIIFSLNNYIYHSFHTLILTSFVLTLLPLDFKDSKDKKIHIQTAKTVWLATALTLITYSCAGVSKVIGTIYDVLESKLSLTSVDFFSIRIAEYWDKGASSQILSPILIDFEILSYILYISVIAIELTAIVTAFRTKYLSYMGIALVMLHWGVANTLGIEFPTAIWILLYCIVLSPFSKKSFHFFTQRQDIL